MSLLSGPKLAPYNPTNLDAVDIALDLLGIQAIRGDDMIDSVDFTSYKLYDLGCGDARLLVKACQRNAAIKGIGIEYDISIVEKAYLNVHDHGFDDKISIIHDNVLSVDFSDADAIFIYLVPEGMKLLRDKLVAVLERGTPIVTYVFTIPNVPYTQVVSYKGSTNLYLYKL